MKKSANKELLRSSLPSDKAAIKKKMEEEAYRKLREKNNKLKKAFEDTPVEVLIWIKEQCGFGTPILGANPQTGDIDPNRTLYSAMRLNLYIQIRDLLSFQKIKQVEFSESFTQEELYD